MTQQGNGREARAGQAVVWDDALQFESSIKWLEPVDQFAYVRVLIVRNCKKPNGRFAPKGGRVVGYSVLRDDAPKDSKTGGYVRRVFYLKDGDLDQPSAETKQLPRSAIDPKSVSAGVAGEAPRLKQEQDEVDFEVMVPDQVPSDGLDEDSSIFGNEVAEMLGDAIVKIRAAEASKAKDSSDAPTDTESAQVDPDGEIGREFEEGNRSVYYGQLSPSDGGKNIPLWKTKVTVGRMEECDVILDANDVSGLHCELTYEEGYWAIKDLHSSNGVKVNQVRIGTERTRIEPGTVISIASQDFEIHYKLDYLGTALGDQAKRAAVDSLLTKFNWRKKQQ